MQGLCFSQRKNNAQSEWMDGKMAIKKSEGSLNQIYIASSLNICNV